jgi:uncharacterized protein (TIGR02186 family)
VRRALLAAWLSAAMGTSAPARLAGQDAGAVRVEPSRAEIGIFYRGVRLTVSGTVDTGTAVAVLVTGPAGDLPLRTQARIWHAFWGPSGHVTYEHIPVLYLLRTSGAVHDLAPAAELHALDIGYDTFQPAEAQPVARAFFPELIRLKESERLFRISEGGVGLEPAPDGRRRVTAVVELPPRAPAATYRVQLFAFRDRRLVLRRETAFTLSRGAFNAFVGSLAREQGLVYGIVAVVVAIGAGFLVGVIFGSSRGH